MRLNSSDIEVKLVNDLKLEEHLYMDCFREIDVRRRRKLSAKKRPGGSRRGEDDMPMGSGDDMMGVDPHHPQHTHNEDDVINQVHNPRSRWESSSTNQNEMMDMHMWDSRAPMKLESSTAPHRLLNSVPRGCYQGTVPTGACI